MHNHVFCIYHDIGRADDVVNRLLTSSIDRKHIGILTTKAAGARHLTLSQEGRGAEGGGGGVSVGGAVGLLCGHLIAAATAGIGVLAAGPLLTGLVGSSDGASAGSLVGIFVGTGIPEAEAKFYAQEITHKGAILIGVKVTDSDRDMVRNIMTKRPLLGIPAHA